ncbi:MAG: methylthioribulose 1-phosphate dehydratase [Bacteroidia bacterium]|nr:methylthioribulose 1-phosphate dehydratase [Bacteroidia bacterium]
MNVNWSEENESLRQELLEIVRIFNDRGWSWATSTNYSFRNPKPMDNTFTISSSGIDKSFFKARDLMVVDEAGQPIEGYQDMKPSAETLLHTMIYQVFPAGAVLHTHSPDGTVLSQHYRFEREIRLAGFEMLKGLSGITSHESAVVVPIFANSQDMNQLSQEIRDYIRKNPNIPGFLLAGHGLYAWGATLAEAKRHVEVLEFLLSCSYKLLVLEQSPSALSGASGQAQRR